MQSPYIVLVNTQMPENIGAAARACMNFGLGDLRLVAPREEWPNKRAYDLAGHGAPVLDNARAFATTREAVADMPRIYAATARGREMVKAVLTPAEAMARIREEGLPAAILFGPERTGLVNDDVAIADAIITIPTASALASLNVAQSVVVLAYEWIVSSQSLESSPRLRGELEGGISPHMQISRSAVPPFPHLTSPAGGGGIISAGTTGPGASPVVHKSPFATKEELQVFFDHLERELDAADFWKVEEKKTKMWINLRNIFTRASLTEQEVRSLHGVIAALKEGR